MKKIIGIASGILAVVLVAAVADGAGVVQRIRGTLIVDQAQATSGLLIGTGGANKATNLLYGCDATSDAVAGPWASRATSTSSSATYTLTGAAVGDLCTYAPGAAVAAGAQALVWTCEVSATNTIRERVTNASGGTLTPTAGKRCALLLRAQ